MPMYSSIRRGIPEFLNDQVVYCGNIMTGKHNLKSTLVLTKQAYLYEFCNKILLNQINLLNTCLNKEHERLKQYTGWRSQWFSTDDNEDSNTHKKSEINFGKYIYMKNFPIKKYYIILQCWQQLVVIERLGNNDGFRIAAEYSDIIKYEITHGPNAYQPIIRIQLKNRQDVETDFQEAQPTIAGIMTQHSDEEFQKQFTASLKQKERLVAELEIAKDLNKRELMDVRDELYLGNNLLRSNEIQEKQQLTRYGDVWLRFTNNHKLVIGVPLVNNCTPPNLTILKDIKAVFMNNNDKSEVQYCYTYHLYQLKMRFENLDSMESFFQCDEATANEASGWQECPSNQMLPETFAVLVIVINIAELTLLHECSLHISYQIEKNLELNAQKKPKLCLFKRQLFVKNFNISEIFGQHATLNIKFSTDTLHQDLLAIFSSAHELKLNLNFNSIEDAEKFENILVEKFNCEIIKRASKLNASSIMVMDLEDTHVEKEVQHFPHMLWYTKINCMWHGLLVIREANDPQDDLQWLWKFYTSDESSSVFLLRMLLEDFLCKDINIKRIECIHEDDNDVIDAIATEPSASLYEGIKKELYYINYMLSTNDIDYKQYLLHLNELNNLQLKTDQAMTRLQKKNTIITTPTNEGLGQTTL